MSKRRALSVVMFRRNHAFRGHVPPIVIATAGTGTQAAAGIFTIVAASTGTFAGWTSYITVSSGTQIGTLCGSFASGGFPI